MSRYESDPAFRVALETRLAAQSRETGVDLNRLRRRVVFERILTRLEHAEPRRWVLKGGMALEVRWPTALVSPWTALALLVAFAAAISSSSQ